MDPFAKVSSAAHSGAYGINNIPEPSLANLRAGNYKKGRCEIHGLRVAIETPQGQRRSGKEDGKPWSVICQAHYGYIEKTRGADGDELDVYIGPWPESGMAYVVNQAKPDGSGFDEHKILMAFPDSDSAVIAYRNSYEKPGPTEMGIVPCTIDQLKWWLKFGNHAIPLTSDQLPYDGTATMNDVTWDSAANPVNMTLPQLLYAMRRDDAGDHLLLDSVTLTDVLEASDGEAVLDALVVPLNRLERKMGQMQVIMRAASKAVRPGILQITPPFKQRGTANVAAIFEMDDGQTVTAYFHNPDATPNKLTPDDEMVSWKWMLNKKDVTIVVAPERGQELNPREVARRIMRLVEANSARFQATNTRRTERMAGIEASKASVAAKQAELDALGTEIATLEEQVEAKRAEGAAQKWTDPVEVQLVYGGTLHVSKSQLADPSIARLNVLFPDGTARIIGGNPETIARSQIESAAPAVLQQGAGADQRLAAVRDAMGRIGWSVSPGYLEMTVRIDGSLYGIMAESTGQTVRWLDTGSERIWEDDPALTADQMAAKIDSEFRGAINAAKAALARSGSPEEQSAADAALAMAAQVVADLGGTFTAEGYSGTGTAGAWSYSSAEVNGTRMKIAASGGGVVAINGKPHDPDGGTNTTPDQVRRSILAVAPDWKSVDPTTESGYRIVSKAGESALLYHQDKLDSFFNQRYIDVRNELRKFGWADDGSMQMMSGPLVKNGATLQVKLRRVGAGRNIVGMSYSISSEPESQLMDTLEFTPAEIAVSMNDNLSRSISKSADETESAVLSALQAAGWVQGDGAALAKKTFKTVNVQQDALAFLTDGDQYNRTLQFEFTSEGRNVTAGDSMLMPNGSPPDVVSRLTAAAIVQAEKSINEYYGVSRAATPTPPYNPDDMDAAVAYAAETRRLFNAGDVQAAWARYQADPNGGGNPNINPTFEQWSASMKASDGPVADDPTTAGDSRSSAIRKEFGKEGRTLGQMYALTVEGKPMFVWQDRVGANAGPGTLYIENLKSGRMLAGDDLTVIREVYRLTGKDELKVEGMPSVAKADEIARWAQAFPEVAKTWPTPTAVADPMMVARAYLATVIDGKADLADSEVADKLSALYEAHNGDAEFDALFAKAADAYQAFMVEAAKKALGN